MMIQKTEEKIRYYLSNNQDDFTLPIYKFEEILYDFTKKSNIKPNKNSYKIYSIFDKYMKIFDDGSCFNYCIRSNEYKKNKYFIGNKIIQQQIHGDEFPGLKTYKTEENYQEIYFKINDKFNLVFLKIIDSNKNNIYMIYFEQKIGSAFTELDDALIKMVCTSEKDL